MKIKLKRINNIEFTCDICSKVFINKSLLQKHKNVHNNIIYKCQLCIYSARNVKSLSKHVKNVHTEPTIPCQVCGKKFHFQCKLKEHLVIHTDTKPHKCKVCGKSFNSTYSLSVHKRIHGDIKPYKCDVCDYACRDGSTLRKHKDRHIGKVKKYPCDICNRQFNASFYLRMHMNEKHFGINVHTIPCDVCGKMYKTKSTLNTHIKTIHGRQFECKCDLCGTVCVNKSNLRAHMMSHVDNRPYLCKYKGCGKKFKCMGDLKKHIIIHYPEQQYTCFCGRRFTRKYRFDDHTKQHERTVQCDMCGDWFKNKLQIALHITKKHDQRYICDFCGYQTNIKTSIVLHIKKGHKNNLKVQSCKICRKTFKRHINLKLHYWKCHSIKYKPKALLKQDKLLKEIDIKKEIDDLKEMELFEVEKKEVLSDIEEYDNNIDQEEITENHKIMENTRKSKRILANNLPDKATVINNDEDLIEKIKRMKVTVKIDKKAKENAENHIQKLLDKSTRKKEMQELEETRRMYNKRISKAIKNKQNKGHIITFLNIKNRNIHEKEINYNESQNNDIQSQNNDKDIDSNDNVIGRNKKLKINTHQCYVCFKLFETKSKLIDHCQIHFDICCNVMLKKCPFCDYVTKKNLSKHILIKHKINIKLPFPNFKDKKHNNDGSRYYYDFKDEPIEKIEIIPSVKNLNKIESIKIDRKRRVERDLTVDKKKLIKKGNEWFVEGEKILLENDNLLPKFNIDDLIKIKINGDDYLSKLKKLSRIAKFKGRKILFPCENCQKICQTLSALKLHTRKHNPNAKPFKRKIWKHKLNGKEIKNNNRYENPKHNLNNNRYENPKPIINKHKCDKELKEFYENNIKGGDIEFWQFLKIYNKISKENITEFSELNNRTDFGIHYDEPKETQIENKIENNKIKRKIEKKPRFNRVIKISKKEYLKRIELKNKLRENISLSRRDI